MITAEMQLLVKIINTGRLPDVIGWGLDEDDFRSEETKNIYRLIHTVYLDPMSNGTVIGPAEGKRRFSHLPLEVGDDPHVKLDYLCSEVRKTRIVAELMEAAHQQSELLASGQLHEALSVMENAKLRAHSLDFTKNIDILGKRGFSEFKAKYMARKQGIYSGAMTWAWAEVTNMIGPIEHADYIIYHGRPKNMKTWMLLVQAFHTLYHDLDSVVVIYTKEMSYSEMYERLASILAHVAFGALRRASLKPEEEKRLFEQIEFAVNTWRLGERLIVLSAEDAAGRDTVSWFGSKLKKHRATAGFVHVHHPGEPASGW